jgi:hypothetical protein
LTFAVLLLIRLADPAAVDAVLVQQATDTLRRTPTPTVTPSPPPAPLLGWRGQVVSNTPSVTSGSGSIVRVSVFERVDEPIVLTSQYNTTLNGRSGTKPEYGPYVAEFAPVPAGRWTVSLPRLNASIEIDVDGYNLVVIEFAPYTPAEATVAAQTTPTPTPIGGERWEGQVVSTGEGPLPEGAILRVTIRGQTGHAIRVSTSDGRFSTRNATGAKEELGPYTAEFAPLTTGRYVITPAGLATSLTLDLKPYTTVVVEFRPVSGWPQPAATLTPTPTFTPAPTRTPSPSPPTPTPSSTPTPQTRWAGRVVRNSSRPWPGSSLSSAIGVRVEGRRGQVVSLRATGGWETSCDTGVESEYGSYACEFGELWPGVYTVSPVGIPAQVSLYMDGVGSAEVAFESFVATATPSPTPTRVMGAGASPARTPTPSPTATLPPTPTATEALCACAATPTPIRPRPTATAIATSTFTSTPTPARGWVGRVVQDEARPGIIGAIVVRVLGLKDQPVILRSGAWSTRGLSGTKPEYGNDAVEFGGLGQGDFTVELEGLNATLPVHLRPGGFLLVEFRYDLLPPPTPTPQHGVWTGAVTHNTSGNSAAAGVWSTIIVKIPGVNNLPVIFSTGGFSTTCITGTKPEYGSGACEIGGLWPGTYRVTPQGLGPSVDVWVDGKGSATVEFWVQ